MKTNLLHMSFLVLIGVFFLTATVRPMPQVTSVLLLLILSYFYFVKIKQECIFSLSNEQRLLSLSLTLMALAAIPVLLIDGVLIASMRELNISAVYLLFALVCLLFFRLKIRLDFRFFVYFVIVAAFLNGLFAVISFCLASKVYRLSAFTGINEYGLVCAVWCVLNAILFIFADLERRLKIFCFLAALLSIVGVVGSGLRGVILAILLVFILVFVGIFLLQHTRKKNIFLSWALMFGALLCCGYLAMISAPFDRIAYSKVEAQKIEGGNYGDSVGLRIQMYKEAWAMFRLSPLVGVSPKARYEKGQEIAAISGTAHILEQVENSNGLIYGKMHNDVLNFMAKRGIIGLATLVFFYCVLLSISYRQRTSIVGKLLFGVIVLYVGAGFSGDPLSGYAEFTILMMVFLSIMAVMHFQNHVMENHCPTQKVEQNP